MKTRYANSYGDRETQLKGLQERGYRVVKWKDCSLVIAFQVREDGKVSAQGWRGAADKPAWAYLFRDLQRAEVFAKDCAAGVKRSEQSRAARQAEERARRATLKASDHWMVGDVFYNSWGYEQTNVDFYQVVEVKAKSIVIRKIAQAYGEQAFMAGPCQPRRNEFAGEPMTKPLGADGMPSMKFGGATKWTGKAVWSSHYA